MRIGIDVTWLKPKKSGGVESFFRNLLDGILTLPDQNDYFLLVAKDNAASFKKYDDDQRISLVTCNTNAVDVISHLVWQNLHQWKIFKKLNVDLCYFPVYEMPIIKFNKLKSITTIHDIQAYHYPEYFPKLENIWYRIGWAATIRNSDKVVAISDFTKEDLKKHFPKADNLLRIHNPIVLNNEKEENFQKLSNLYGITRNEYYYTVCSMHKHKNLISLVNMIEKICLGTYDIPKKLVISGVSGPNKNNFMSLIEEKKLKDNVILTNFISNEERNCLIENCNVFLFPSLFEGFGMPPVEAMMLGSRVLSTRLTSLQEVTKNQCRYIDNPCDEQEWIDKIIEYQTEEPQRIEFPEYSKENIAKEYLNLFYKVSNKR